MKNLLYKELRLCVPVQTWIFVALNCLCIIPNYPAVATLLYPLSGFSVLVSVAQSDRDPLYTSLLPVHKKDVVKAKMLLVCFLQIVSLLIAIPFAMVKRFVLSPMMPEESHYADIGFNLTSLGAALLLYGFYNLLFFPLYYKNPESRRIAPFLIPPFATALLGLVISAPFMAYEPAADFINDWSSPLSWGIRIASFIVGLAAFFLLSLWADKAAEKRFQKIDL